MKFAITKHFSFATSAVLARPAAVSQIFGYYKGADAWLHVFDLAALPSNGVEGNIIIPLWAKTSFNLPFEPFATFSAGVVAAISTTEDTLTIIGSTDGKFTFIYA